MTTSKLSRSYGAAEKDSQRYYHITESSYLKLDEDETPFMNLGLWPAQNIKSAQTRLYDRVLSDLKTRLAHQPYRILELGSGWGGGRSIVSKYFPDTPYIGINSSNKQSLYSRKNSLKFQNTEYVEDFLENLENINLLSSDTAFAIETLLHVELKSSTLRTLHGKGIRNLALAEICSPKVSDVLKNPLFNPSLKYLWPVHKYTEVLKEVGYLNIEIFDISSQVFQSWSSALNRIESSSFQGNKKVLCQFQKSYSDLNDLHKMASVSYNLIFANCDSP